jgi:cell division protein FtsI (penicillin-binding protein 3)
MVADIIRRSASFLGVKPDFKQEFAPAASEIASADSIND